jgi:hypothetical protein
MRIRFYIADIKRIRLNLAEGGEIIAPSNNENFMLVVPKGSTPFQATIRSQWSSDPQTGRFVCQTREGDTAWVHETINVPLPVGIHVYTDEIYRQKRLEIIRFRWIRTV